MSKQRSLKMNFIMNALLTMSSFIFPLITFPYISRILLPTGMGKVNFATSIINYFLLFSQLGIPTYGIRACARVRDNKEELTRVTHELLFINIVISILSYIVFFITVFTVPRLYNDKTLFILMSFTIILTAIGMEWLYRALEQYTYITVRSIIFKFIALAAMFLLIHKQSDYVIYGAITIFASSASSILNFINAGKYISFKPVGHYQPQRHLRAVATFFAMSCAVTIYTNLDSVMLGFMKTDADVGYYGAAVKIKSILVSIVTSLGTVLLPRASYYIQTNEIDKFKALTKKALNFVFLIALPLMIYFILFAKEGIYFLSGQAFKNSIIPMQIIMPTLLIIGISNITGIQILVPLGYEKAVLYSEIVGSIVDILLNWLLIPRFASAGAAFGTLVAEASVLLVQYLYIRNEFPNLFKGIKYLKLLIANIFALLLSFWIPLLGQSHFITLLISAILYFSVYGITLILLKESLAHEIFNQLKAKLLYIIKR